MYDLQLPRKGFWQIIVSKFKNDPVWLNRVWSCCLCFSISHNLRLLDLLLDYLIYVFSRIWRDLHRDVEIDRNRRSEELLRLGTGQKIFIFRREGVRGEGGLLFEGVGKFSF